MERERPQGKLVYSTDVQLLGDNNYTLALFLSDLPYPIGRIHETQIKVGPGIYKITVERMSK